MFEYFETLSFNQALIDIVESNISKWIAKGKYHQLGQLACNGLLFNVSRTNTMIAKERKATLPKKSPPFPLAHRRQ